MLKKFLKRLTRVLKSTTGYTLVEVAAVVAVTGTLAAVAVPVAKDQVNSGKTAAAVQDVAAIAGAINQLRGDTGVFPVFKTSIGRLANKPDVTLLASKAGTMPSTGSGVTGSVWGSEGGSEGSLPVSAITVTTGKTSYLVGSTVTYVALGADAFENHLISNSTDGEIAEGAAGLLIHDEKTWNGPYFGEDIADPWGHKYLCNIGKAYEWDNGKDIPTQAVFVLSAGPDGIIQTSFDQALEDEFLIGGDDIASRVQ